MLKLYNIISHNTVATPRSAEPTAEPTAKPTAEPVVYLLVVYLLVVYLLEQKKWAT